MNTDNNKQVYLLTNTDSDGVKTPVVYADFRVALKSFRELYDQCTAAGYTGYETATFDNASYTRNAKLISRDAKHTVKLRLVLVPYVGFNVKDDTETDGKHTERDGEHGITFTDDDRKAAEEEAK